MKWEFPIVGWILVFMTPLAYGQSSPSERMPINPTSAPGLAEQLNMCSTPALVPITKQTLIASTPGSIKVLADKANIVTNETGRFDGNVQIISPNANIFANSATIINDGERVIATGDVRFVNPNLQVRSSEIALDTQRAEFAMDAAAYQLTALSGRGEAEGITLSSAKGVVLDEVSFTTCPLGNNDWRIQASEINLGQAGNLGQAYNTRIYVKDVPVFYLPYFAFPVTSARQSGLLFPKLSSSSENGIDYTQPYYWNIAPNYDATISPRLLTNRGLMLDTEFRYLSELSQGQIRLEFLPNDDEAEGEKRYFVRIQNVTQLSDNWFLNIDFNQISDGNYIVDFGSDFFNRADTYVQQNASLTYQSERLDVTLRVADFTIIGEQANNYRAVPELQLSYHLPLHQNWQFDINSELAHFTNTNQALASASRFHIAPQITFNSVASHYQVDAELGAMTTFYKQQGSDNNTQLAEEKTRNLGRARIFGAMFFERPQTITGVDSVVTLEPQVQYLYTSYADQSDIGLYDSAPLLNNVQGLFRGQEFSGLDRIVDNNQLTVALTSRFLDANSQERASINIGQIFYFDDSKVLAIERSNQRSSLAAEFDFRLSNRWFFDSQLQLASQTDKVERTSITLAYRKDSNSLIQLSQRYIRNLANETINQVGFSATWPINEHWQWAGRWYRDSELNRTIESYFGLEYESCCWALRVVGYRHLANRYAFGQTQTNAAEFDSGVALQFRFKGLSSARRQDNMLRNGMFGYRQSYAIN